MTAIPSPRRATPRLLACAVLVLAVPEQLRAEGVSWRTDYAAALKEAAQRGVPLFVNVGTADCFWCKKLDQHTFLDEDVVKLLNERCIPLKLDASKPANDYLVRALRVQSYPTLIFASHDGGIVGYREGFLEASAMKEQITRTLAAVATPDWMQRDFDSAGKAIAAGETGKAISLPRPQDAGGAGGEGGRARLEGAGPRRQRQDGRGDRGAGPAQQVVPRHAGVAAGQRADERACQPQR
jgi:hypothetical protein